MSIENRKLEPGTRLSARYKKQTYTAEVVETPEGLRFRLEDGREFKSPSAAGKAVVGGSCNGWRFWSLEGDLPAGREEKPRAVEGNGKEHKLISRVPNQKGLPEGQTRFFCSACMKSFFAEGTPEGCPEGHREGDPAFAI
jgi:hypothetical protein